MIGEPHPPARREIDRTLGVSLTGDRAAISTMDRRGPRLRPVDPAPSAATSFAALLAAPRTSGTLLGPRTHATGREVSMPELGRTHGARCAPRSFLVRRGGGRRGRHRTGAHRHRHRERGNRSRNVRTLRGRQPTAGTHRLRAELGDLRCGHLRRRHEAVARAGYRRLDRAASPHDRLRLGAADPERDRDHPVPRIRRRAHHVDLVARRRRHRGASGARLPEHGSRRRLSRSSR